MFTPVSILFLVLTALMALVIYYDATRYIIPNWLNGLLLALWPALFFIAPPVAWQPALMAFGGMFAVCAILHLMRLMGGGDFKLLSVCALWTSLPALPDFAFYTALMGGVLALLLIIARRLVPARDTLPRIFQKKAPVPYGLAIASAFLTLLWTQRLPGLAL